MALAPAPEFLVFMSRGSGFGALYFHSMTLASVRFYTLAFSIVLVCLKLNGK